MRTVQTVGLVLAAAAFVLVVLLSGPLRVLSDARRGLMISRDRPYVVGGTERQRLDLYLPMDRTDNSTPLPIIVWMHGGAWRSGSRRAELPGTEALVRSQYAVASVGYRLSQDAPHPAQQNDCVAAIRWLRKNATSYNLDPDRIAVAGVSAGGHLAMLVGLGEEAESLGIVACGSFLGVSDLQSFHQDAEPPHDRLRPDVETLLGGPFAALSERAAAASPITLVSPDDPPCLIVHGVDDAYVPLDQAVRLHEALTEVGVPSHLMRMNGYGHDNAALSRPDVTAAVRTFFDAHLKGDGRCDLPADGTIR